MDSKKIVKVFDKFVDKKFADSEEMLRPEIQQTVNDYLKTKLDLKNDPIVSKQKDDE